MTNRWLDGLTVSEETSLALLDRARRGDAVALEALMGRYLTRFQRWAAGRVPPDLAAGLDADHVVQDELLSALRRPDAARPSHDGLLLTHMRTAVRARIQSELRRAAASPATSAAARGDAAPSLLETMASRPALDRYERALADLDEDERAAIVGRFELGYSYDALARAMVRQSAEDARRLTERALRRLIDLMHEHDR